MTGLIHKPMLVPTVAPPQAPKDPSVEEILEQAREKIQGGWLQGQSYAIVGRQQAFCATGAIMWGHRYDEDHSRAVSTLWESLPKTYKLPDSDLNDKRSAVQRFNDNSSTKQKDVVDLFSRALDDLRGESQPKKSRLPWRR